MKIEVNGIQYTNFTKAKCKLRLDALSSLFSFTAVANGADRLPFRAGHECKVYADDVLVLTGKIESVMVDYDGSNHTITYAGRDKTADILDSSIGVMDNISGQELTLKAIIERVIKHLGLDIKVVQNLRVGRFKEDEDLPNPEIGQNAFEFIETLARKRQVLLTSNENGDIVIKRNDGEPADGVIQHVIDADDNNVLSATFTNNISERFSLYKVSSGMNVAAGAETGGSVDALTSQSGEVVDPNIRSGRQMIIIAETPTGEGIEARAIWEADVRKARGKTYDCTVSGFRVGIDSGDIWRTAKTYTINDDFIQLNSPMLCNAVTFMFDDEGHKTDLELIGSEAYQLNLPSGVEEFGDRLHDLAPFGVLLSDANEPDSFGVRIEDAN